MALFLRTSSTGRFYVRFLRNTLLLLPKIRNSITFFVAFYCAFYGYTAGHQLKKAYGEVQRIVLLTVDHSRGKRRDVDARVALTGDEHLALTELGMKNEELLDRCVALGGCLEILCVCLPMPYRTALLNVLVRNGAWHRTGPVGIRTVY